ncbi:RbsD/FucU family protein [Rhodococcus opacus]|uniref:RbsD/FucU family protein n=1 Tax=Rhodococcus opacus TaxID=37919 RepID=A0AAX3YT39_RHOOP|nr:RbsD/FucU family protein [Rhodococcus opacus]MCZ4590216.1 RbsD/FucU family protein [Rhodococcus opacus]WLF52318.1 RbsD/FucU family protein [Rhodococcus opacus]
MITSRLTHPDILAALAGAGHGSTVLVTDAHYAARTAVGANATTVHLNLEAGRPRVPQVLAVLLDSIPIEKITRIRPSADCTPCPIHDEIDTLLTPTLPRELVDRFDFYALARSPDLALAVITGDTRRFGNVLLTVGVLHTPPTAQSGSRNHSAGPSARPVLATPPMMGAPHAPGVP